MKTNFLPNSHCINLITAQLRMAQHPKTNRAYSNSAFRTGVYHVLQLHTEDQEQSCISELPHYYSINKLQYLFDLSSLEQLLDL